MRVREGRRGHSREARGALRGRVLRDVEEDRVGGGGDGGGERAGWAEDTPGTRGEGHQVRRRGFLYAPSDVVHQAQTMARRGGGAAATHSRGRVLVLEGCRGGVRGVGASKVGRRRIHGVCRRPRAGGHGHQPRVAAGAERALRDRREDHGSVDRAVNGRECGVARVFR